MHIKIQNEWKVYHEWMTKGRKALSLEKIFYFYSIIFQFIFFIVTKGLNYFAFDFECELLF